MEYKISVLLPTRNRLELAKNAIETVLRQRYQNWELIVADNDSDDNYRLFIEALRDKRVIYTRSSKFLSVTENWNNALSLSSGDFVAMIGDDDGLTPQYFERILQLIEEFQGLDFIYHGAFQFTYPYAIEATPESKLVDVTCYSRILQGFNQPRLLTQSQAHWVARNALNIKVMYAFNMQHFLFSKEFVSHIKNYGPFFQGPFPDFYVANMAMFLGRKMIVVPEPLIFIGISPKSYGYFHYNRREREGIEFLNSNGLHVEVPEQIKKNLLPGSYMNSSWLVSVSLVKEKLDPHINGLKLGIGRYRLFQMHETIQTDFLSGEDEEQNRLTLEPYLSIFEKGLLNVIYFFVRHAGSLRIKLLKLMKWLFMHLQYTRLNGNKPWEVVDKYQTILEAFDDLQ